MFYTREEMNDIALDYVRITDVGRAQALARKLFDAGIRFCYECGKWEQLKRYGKGSIQWEIEPLDSEIMDCAVQVALSRLNEVCGEKYTTPEAVEDAGKALNYTELKNIIELAKCDFEISTTEHDSSHCDKTYMGENP